jgi:hypothetical protein
MAKRETISPATDQIGSALSPRDPLAADYAELTSFDDAFNLLTQTFGDVVSAEELGDGFSVLDNKDVLEGVPLILLRWDFRVSEEVTRKLESGGEVPAEYVSARVMTRDGRKFIVNDGSTGLYKQLVDFTNKTERQGGLYVPHGLRKSEYWVETPDGKKRAATFYLDTSSS